MSSSRTLWEQGRRPGRLTTLSATLVVLGIVAIDLRLTERLSVLFDVSFVLICVVAALSVRPRDFFVIGVLPPLLMAATVLVLALLARHAVADPGDGLGQAVVSGLAHHAGALVAGYALTLGILALRQVAARNAGRLRASSTTHDRQRPAVHVG